ncbi:unnamed protein product [Symbiodinium natans]|uniref:Uncharacterized protein n=1 Tax=Symbiodinium natans TaxID=878477 RepID=A0A812U0A9_9DINO|nr:unnamed protein product [Symbiodinium natans]
MKGAVCFFRLKIPPSGNRCLAMGCGASTQNVSHHKITLSQLIPAHVPSQQHADVCLDRGTADPNAAKYEQSSSKEEHEEPGPVVLHGRSSSGAVEEESGEESGEDKDIWSSWSSRCWRDRPRIPANASLPPDRRSHARHLRRLVDFRREVERAPKTFAEMVYLHRSQVRNVRVLPDDRKGQQS